MSSIHIIIPTSEDNQQLLDMQRKRKMWLMVKEKKQGIDTDPKIAMMSALEKATVRIYKFLILS